MFAWLPVFVYLDLCFIRATNRGTNKKEFSSADGLSTYSYNKHGTKMNEKGFVYICAYVYMAKWILLHQKNTLRPKLFGRDKWTKTENEKNTDYSTTDRRKMSI